MDRRTEAFVLSEDTKTSLATQLVRDFLKYCTQNPKFSGSKVTKDETKPKNNPHIFNMRNDKKHVVMKNSEPD